ncbi:hypothetical protein BDZ89DRAFT_1141310 [Hymenopellis radicata]|nr:hypothetical protein BDZ89DRAFT_1141310 [Hymenopellis radicata]
MNITIIPTPPPAPVTDSAAQVPSRLYSGLQTLLLCTVVAVAWLIGLSLLIITYATFTLLGYALLSISTIPHGHALSVFYASLIGGAVLLPPICITSEVAFRYTCRCIFPRYRESYRRFGVEDSGRVLV